MKSDYNMRDFWGRRGDRTILRYDGGVVYLTLCLFKLRLFNRSRVWLICDCIDYSHQALLSKGFVRQEYLSRLPFPFPGESSWSRDQTHVPCIAGEFFTTEPGKPKTQHPTPKVVMFIVYELNNKEHF